MMTPEQLRLLSLLPEIIDALGTVRHLDCGAHYCRYCAAKSPKWTHEPYCAYQESIRETTTARSLAEALRAYVTTDAANG